MTPEQITAIAREYAEEYTRKKYPNAPGHVRERIIEGRLEHMEDFIPWLLQRFCLVEKSVAKQFFQSRQNILTNQDKYDRYIVDEASTEKRLMLCLFPEITKEVEA